MATVGGWLLALGGGVVWSWCFGRQPWVVAPWLALAPLLMLLGQRRAAALGWLHGLAFWLVSIPWIVPTLESYGGLPGWLARVSLLALASYLALFHSLFAAVGQRLWRRGGARALIALPALWVTVEWLRGHLFGGFPWNLAAYSWIAVPGALPLAAWLGAYGVSYLVLLANTGVALSVAQRRWRLGTVTVSLCLLMLAVAARWAAPSSTGGDLERAVAVRLLQPNSEVSMEWNEARVEHDYQKVLQQSRRACDRPGALLIWPESAAWPYSYPRNERLQRDLENLARRGCSVVMNTAYPGREGVYNSVLLLDAEGIAGRYDKRHLVPFGEYVPMAGWLPFLNKIARNAGDFLSGETVALLSWAGQQIGVAICFEVTFPEEVAEQVRAGASMLVTVTNDGWYGDSWAPWQHYRAARFRAAENRRYVLRAALTGVSAIVNPDGSVAQQLGVGREGLLTARVSGRRDLTPYTRAPLLLPAACLILVAFAIFSGGRGRTR